MNEFNDSTPTDVVKCPMVPIRDVVVFPYTMVAFVIGRPASVRALEAALRGDKTIFLATQHDATIDEPVVEQVYSVGTIARITHNLRLPDGNIKVMVEGIERAKSVRVEDNGDYWLATLRKAPEQQEARSRLNSLIGRVGSLVDQYVRQSTELSNPETLTTALRNDDPARLCDTIASNLKISVEDKQGMLEIFSLQDRLARLVEVLEVELEKIQVDRAIHGRVKRQMERAQKEYYLNEKIKAIHKELGRKDEKAEIEELKQKIEAAGMSKDAYEKATAELRRLEQMPPMSAESTVSRNYLDWLLAVPWQEKSEEVRDIRAAQEVLDNDHYGLEKVKERILEYLAVRQLVERPKGSILCFVGPPGVGKTSLGRSIAKATGRKFVRLSLGGVRDEAEIRGHRRTYIGALPGQIIQMMKKAGTINPLIMLDEVEKLGMDFRGDPSAALLEVLDPEQNFAFHDHYLDVEYDLSNAMFIATANVIHTIPPALQDRLEIIRLPGYTEREKLQIAMRHLMPKQFEANGLTADQIDFLEEGIATITQYYTREAGVRNLEREIASVLRKLARRMLTSEDPTSYRELVDGNLVKELLGPTRFRPQSVGAHNEVGLATGLAWTDVGGEVLHIEATLMPGRGNITLTGKLGEVMQESARAALTCVRSRAKELGISPDFHKKYDLHLHVPEGAIPKDGPSAGIAIATAIVSVLTRVAIRRDVAMTGEITLRGKVLPIGGVKEKLLAAHRAGITTIVLPNENGKDLVELPADVKEALSIHLVDFVDEVWRIALEGPTVTSEAPTAEVPTSEVPIWGQQPPAESPTANQVIE
ncbi:MAG TPA: endopeptidase La [Blastocatellia bacterium]|nr:endopeptidase La [Blastocatellia bacterium]